MRNSFKWLVTLSLGYGFAAAAAAESKHTVDFTLPSCDTSDSQVKIIDSNSDWNDINNSSYRVFCVKPGDYTGAGSISLSADGTQSEPRYIRYFSDSDSGAMPWQQSQSERAIIESLQMKEADWWVINRMTITDPDYSSGKRYLLNIRENSDNNLIVNTLVEKSPVTTTYVGKGSDNNTLYRNVFRETRQSSTEAHCLFVNAGSEGDPSSYQDVKNLRVIANEFYNCNGDTMQFWTSNKDNPSGGIPGLVIYNNDLYITPDLYTDGNGNSDPNGKYACAEDALDFKVGVLSSSPSESEVMDISHNRMWGFRRADSTACPALQSPGVAVALHKDESDYANIFNNIIFDAAVGIYTSRDADNINVKWNLLHKVSTSENGGLWGAFMLTGNGGVLSDNIINASSLYLKANGSNYDVKENYFLDAGDWQTQNGSDLNSSAVGYNNYYNTNVYDGTADAGNNSVSSSSDGVGDTHCFDIKRLTSPTSVCIPNAVISGVIAFDSTVAPSAPDLAVQ